jgi:hypothetical protein
MKSIDRMIIKHCRGEDSLNNRSVNILSIILISLVVVIFVFFSDGANQHETSVNIVPPPDKAFQMPYRYHNYDYFYDLDYGFNSLGINDSLISSKRNVIFAAVLRSEELTECVYFAEGLRQEAKARNAGMLISYSNNDVDQEDRLVNEYLRNNVDAIIVFPVQKQGTYQTIRHVKRENTPIITLWSAADELCMDMVDCFVGTDRSALGEMLAHYVMQRQEYECVPILLVGDEIDEGLDKFLQKINDLANERSVYMTRPDSFERACEEISKMHEHVVAIFETPNVAVDLRAKKIDGLRMTRLTMGEEHTMEYLMDEMVIDGGVCYSSDENGKNAVNAAMMIANREKPPVRIRPKVFALGE